MSLIKKFKKSLSRYLMFLISSTYWASQGFPVSTNIGIYKQAVKPVSFSLSNELKRGTSADKCIQGQLLFILLLLQLLFLLEFWLLLNIYLILYFMCCEHCSLHFSNFTFNFQLLFFGNNVKLSSFIFML